MITQISKRKQAYSFIVNKIKKLKASDYYRLNKTVGDDNYISLGDLEGLKNGTSDPTPELVISLKHLLRDSAIAAEIDKYLVQPFK